STLRYMLDVERQYFADHLTELLQQHRGRFVAIKDQVVVGVFDTPEAALREAARRFGLEPVLVRRVEDTPAEVSIPALTLGLLHADPARSIQRDGDKRSGSAGHDRS